MYLLVTFKFELWAWNSPQAQTCVTVTSLARPSPLLQRSVTKGCSMCLVSFPSSHKPYITSGLGSLSQDCACPGSSPKSLGKRPALCMCLKPCCSCCSVVNSCPGLCNPSGLQQSLLCHPTILYSVVLFSSCLQCFPASRSFPMIGLFGSDGQCIGASAWVLPMNIQDWLPLELTSLISLQSKGL